MTPKGNVSKRVLRTLGVDFGYKAAWDLEQLEPNTFFPVPVLRSIRPERRAERNSNTAGRECRKLAW